MPDGKVVPVALMSNEYLIELYDRMRPVEDLSPAESEMMGKSEPDDPRWKIIEKETKRRGLDNRRTIMIDIDGVVANLHVEWLKRYNIEFDDDLKQEEITAWQMTDFVKEECGNTIYKYLRQDDLYINVPEIDHAFWGVNVIRGMGFKVKFVSAGYVGGKMKWMFDHHFITDADDYIIAEDKESVEGDCLIDDYYEKNIVNFIGTGRPAILFSQPWNYVFDYVPRANNWSEVIKRLEELYGKTQFNGR